MPEILTESFCERCGTRYTFQAAAPKGRRASRLKVFGKGLKNFVLSDDASLSEALADARSDQLRDVSTQQLDAFHQTFNFCMSCRQYTCGNCWNEREGRCLTCAPHLGHDILAAPFPGLEPAAGVAPDLIETLNGHPSDGIPGTAEPADDGAMAWPELDLRRITAPEQQGEAPGLAVEKTPEIAVEGTVEAAPAETSETPPDVAAIAGQAEHATTEPTSPPRPTPAIGLRRLQPRVARPTKPAVVGDWAAEEEEPDISPEEAAAAAAELQRIAEERAAASRVAAEAERLAAEQEEAERLAAEQAEAERIAAEQAEAERIAAEQAEAERIAAEQAEAERIAAELAEVERRAEEARRAAEQAEAERLAAERAEADRLAAEQVEAERIAAELAEAERVAEEARLAAERAETERLAAELADAERVAAIRAEEERQEEERRLVAERAEADRRAEEARLAAEQAEAARVAAERAEAKRVAEEKAAAERIADELAEAQRRADEARLAAEQAEAERLAAEQAEAERVAAEQAESTRQAEEAARAADAEPEAPATKAGPLQQRMPKSGRPGVVEDRAAAAASRTADLLSRFRPPATPEGVQPEADEAAAEPAESQPPTPGREDRVEAPVWRTVAPEPATTADGVTRPEPAAPAAPGEPQWPTPQAQPQWPTSGSTPGWPAPSASSAPLLDDTRSAAEILWAASTQEVLAKPATQPGGGIQPCVSCGLSLSATARFCRRCGTRQG